MQLSGSVCTWCSGSLGRCLMVDLYSHTILSANIKDLLLLTGKHNPSSGDSKFLFLWSSEWLLIKLDIIIITIKC